MSDLFAWVPWFQELARKIAEGGPGELSRRAKEIAWKADGTEANLVKHGDKNIDPFSFFYVLASKNSWDSVRKRVHSEVSERFDLATQTDFASGYYYPTPSPRTKLLFHDAGAGHPDLFWSLFRAAIRAPEAVEGAEFDAALAIPGVGMPKLTETLFLINPTAFLPFDNQSLIPLQKKLNRGNRVSNWDTYRQEAEAIQKMFPGCEPYEIQHFAYAVFGRKDLDVTAGKVWRSSTYVDGYPGDDYWSEYRENGWIYHRGRGRGEKRPLDKPSRGDLVLVHAGTTLGHGIGVVDRNTHKENWAPEQRLHVLWLNTAEAEISGSRQPLAFSSAKTTLDAFRGAQAYAPTFDLLKRLGWKDDSGKDNPVPPSPLETLAEKTLIGKRDLREIIGLLDDKKQIIFQGPPGTGKTYLARELTKCLAGSNEGRVRLVQFHPSYSYEDFIQGYRPTLKDGQAGFELRDGPLLEMAELARKSDEKHFLVIDEINRGNLSKILGELYFLLEYRDEDIRLQYAKKNKLFFLPPNLYIIGTMNTADRSIALVDLALRRRFHFVEFHPDKSPIEGLLGRWLDRHAPKMRWVEQVVAKANQKLDDRHAAIGPSYFMREGLNDAMVQMIWEHNVLPYVEERLFGQEDRLAEFGLGRIRKEAQGQPPPPEGDAADGASGTDEPDHGAD